MGTSPGSASTCSRGCGAGLVLARPARPGRRGHRTASRPTFTRDLPAGVAAASEAAILEDPSIQMVVAATVPADRAPLGIRVMQHGKDYMTDKPGFTTLEQLAEARSVQAETGRIYSVCYSERFENPRRGEGRRAGRRRARSAGWCRRSASGRTACNCPPRRLVLPARALRRHPVRHRLAPVRPVPVLHRLDQAEVVTAQVANYKHPEHPELEDFGDDACCAATAAPATCASTGTRRTGLPTWGDGRLTILGTEGYIELRKYIDIAGRPGRRPPVPGGPQGHALHRLRSASPCPTAASSARRAQPHRDGHAAGRTASSPPSWR